MTVNTSSKFDLHTYDMKYSNHVKWGTVKWNQGSYLFHYLKTEEHDCFTFDVVLDHLDLNTHTGRCFKVSWQRTNHLLLYPVKSMTDLAIKQQVIHEIFALELLSA